MAIELRSYVATIPAGTPLAAPVTIDVSFPQAVTDKVEWHVPRGASGLMGWRLTSGGGQVIPKNQGAWVIADNETGVWELAQLHDSGAWQVTGYNTGAFPHSVHVRFHTRPVPAQDPLLGSLSWMFTGRRAIALAEIGAMAAAPEVVRVPRSALWPLRGR